jgi:hypothetical protein
MTWRPTRRGVLIGVGVAGAAGVAALYTGANRFDRSIERRVDGLLADARPPTEGTVTRGEFEDLPGPVARYFDHVLPVGEPYARTVEIDHRGEFRLGDADSPWRPFTSTQHYTVAPPGFVWDATIELFPMVPVRVVDAYAGGTGVLEARALGAIPVAEAEPSPELDAGELKRYLAESVWFPTALLPAAGVEWEPRDDQSAVATLEHDDTRVSVTFHFDGSDEIVRVTSDRPRQVDGSYEPTPWVGRFENYRRRNGRLIPLDGEVGWSLPGGYLGYWRGTVASIDHRTAAT